MKTHEEIYENVLIKRNEYEAKKDKRNKILLKTGITAFSLMLVLGAITLSAKGNIKKTSVKGTNSGIFDIDKEISTIPGTALSDYAPESALDVDSETKNTWYETTEAPKEEKAKEKTTDKNRETTIKTTKVANNLNDPYSDGLPETVTEGFTVNRETLPMPDSYGGNDGYFPLDASLINGVCITLTGEKITDEELEKYISENAKSIVSGIAFDKGSGEYKVCTKGYNHIRVREKGDLNIDLSYRDCPILKDGKIVGVVTVYKENNKLYNSVSYGGEGAKALQKAFDENPTDKLVFVYDGICPEIIIAPNNKMYFIPFEVKYEKGVDYYGAFNETCNTFSKADLEKGVTVEI